MSKHLNPACLYKLPSGAAVHPCRLIHRDGSLMWKHALLNHGHVNLPVDETVEHSIIHTAKRLEELNTWVSPNLNPWECFQIHAWYNPNDQDFQHGTAVLFTHCIHSNELLYNELKLHLQEKEALSLTDFRASLKFQTA